MIYFSLLAFIAGVLITAQTSLNSQLGQMLKSPAIATSIAFAASLCFTLIGVNLFSKDYPSTESIRSVPFYMWFAGGLLSAIGVYLFYWLIPQIGAAQMLSLAMAGQITLAILADHFGWFDLPVKPLTVTKVFGVFCLLAGVFLVNRE